MKKILSCLTAGLLAVQGLGLSAYAGPHGQIAVGSCEAAPGETAVSAAPQQGENVITHLEVDGIPLPAVGEKPVYTCEMHGHYHAAGIDMTPPDDPYLMVQGINWVGGYQNVESVTGVFENWITYAVVIWVTADDGYSFPENAASMTATMNGIPVVVNQVNMDYARQFKEDLNDTVGIELHWRNGQFLDDQVEASITAAPSATTAAVTATTTVTTAAASADTLIREIALDSLALPEIGQHPSYTFRSLGPYHAHDTNGLITRDGNHWKMTVQGVTWWNETDSEVMDNGQYYQQGKVYSVQIALLADAGYVFRESYDFPDVTATVNGIPAQVSKYQYTSYVGEPETVSGVNVKLYYKNGQFVTDPNAPIVTTAKPVITTTKPVTTTTKPVTSTKPVTTTKPVTSTKPVTTTVTYPSAQIYAQIVRANPGETVRIPVFLLNNPGITALSLSFSYDSTKLELLGVEDGGVFAGADFTAGGDLKAVPYTVMWDSVSRSNMTANGILAYLQVRVPEDAEGNIPIDLSLNQKSTFNVNLEEVPFDVLYGMVMVQPATTTTQPLTTTAKAVTTTTKPVTTTTKAATTTAKLVTTTAKPVTTTTKPVATTTKAVTTTTKAATTTAKPVTTTAKPVTTTAQPVTTTVPVMTTTAPAPTGAAVIVGTASAEKGGTVEVPVRLENNPGIAALSLNVTYDPAQLKLLEVTDGKILGSSAFTPGGDLSAIPFMMNWDDLSTENNTGNGTVAVLKFEVLAEGTLPVSVTVNQSSTFNVDLDDVAFATVSGGVTASPAPEQKPLKGDVNLDGAVSVDDAQLALRAYANRIAGNPTGLNAAQTKNADVNEDGELSVDDAQNILIYYVNNTVAGKVLTWEELLSRKKG